MTKEDYERGMLLRLRENLQRYPAMGSEDIVKFVFQGMLGPGHLLADRATVVGYIEKEMGGLLANPDEPLLEPVSPAWSRLNLRRAMAECISAERIADWMVNGEKVPFTRKDVYDLFCRMNEDESFPLSRSAKELEQILDANWLPSHSAAYRACYHPAYRVIPEQASER